MRFLNFNVEVFLIKSEFVGKTDLSIFVVFIFIVIFEKCDFIYLLLGLKSKEDGFLKLDICIEIRFLFCWFSINFMRDFRIMISYIRYI